MAKESSKQSGVIWISGYSSSGKTTVGRHVEYLLRSSGHSTIFLDGDQLRSIFGNKWAYTAEQRSELALIYFRLCSHLSKQGITVIIAAVAMLDEVRQWFKENVENGLEVYLNVPELERISRDSETKKNIYSKKSLDNSVYTEPKNPDVFINNYGAISHNDAGLIVVKKYLERVVPIEADYGRTLYWSKFYKKKLAVNYPSPFAEFCFPRILNDQRLLEIGCGNGRDSQYFAEKGVNVVALDKSQDAIEICKQRNNANNLNYFCCETSELENHIGGKYDFIYSRFSLHAMTVTEEMNTLNSAFNLLESNGYLFIECISINDILFRKGEVLSPTERLDGHYCRFIDLAILNEKLENIGFTVIESTESSGLAVFKDEDPVVIRIFAKK
tara:strand:- start:3642 stop:4799 length:1158 start_codon:yes stop_codon:yes gene_type:complete